MIDAGETKVLERAGSKRIEQPLFSEFFALFIARFRYAIRVQRQRISGIKLALPHCALHAAPSNAPRMRVTACVVGRDQATTRSPSGRRAMGKNSPDRASIG